MNSSKNAIRSALLILTTGIIIASLFYGENYQYLKDPVSSLGRIATGSGYPNIVSHIVFASACLIASIFLFSAYLERKNVLILLISTGVLLMPVPCDRFPLLHQVAAAAVVGGAWLYSTPVLGRYNLFFQPPVLLYGFLHIAGSELKEEFQTFAVAAILAGMYFCTFTAPDRARKSRRGGDQRHWPAVFRKN